ncbi:MAG: nuclear transport factor 2 family protein [Actinomycetota bacterium]
MSQENVETFRQVIEAWNQRDEDRAVSYMAPDVEWAPAGPAAVERTVYRGREECSRGFAAVWETWDEFHFEETEVRDLGDSVLWLGHVQMRGKTSHVELDQEFANHVVLVGGKIVRVHAFLTWRKALETAGLRE